MNRIFMWLLVTVLAIGFVGCVEVDTEVVVKPDGTGTITVVTGMSGQMVELMKSMMMGMGMEEVEEEGEAKPSFEETQKAEYAKKAKDFGEGVKLTDFSQETKNGKVYSKAVYTFEDINNIKIASNTGMNQQGADSKAKEFTFRFKQLEDNTAELIVTIPRDESVAEEGEEAEEAEEETEETEEQEEAEESAEENKQMEAMMKQMLGDMKISFTLVCGSEILKTNATWKEKNKIILMEINFGSLLNDEANMKKLVNLQKKQAQSTKDPAAMAQILKEAGIEGIKVELNEELTIEFK